MFSQKKLGGIALALAGALAFSQAVVAAPSVQFVCGYTKVALSRRSRDRLHALEDAIGRLADSSAEIDKLRERLIEARERLCHLSGDDAWDGLRWLDVTTRSIRLYLTPLDVSDTLGSLINAARQAWVFTSATLAIGV